VPRSGHALQHAVHGRGEQGLGVTVVTHQVKSSWYSSGFPSYTAEHHGFYLLRDTGSV
jgi:hypothetical protein